MAQHRETIVGRYRRPEPVAEGQVRYPLSSFAWEGNSRPAALMADPSRSQCPGGRAWEISHLSHQDQAPSSCFRRSWVVGGRSFECEFDRTHRPSRIHRPLSRRHRTYYHRAHKNCNRLPACNPPRNPFRSRDHFQRLPPSCRVGGNERGHFVGDRLRWGQDTRICVPCPFLFPCDRGLRWRSDGICFRANWYTLGGRWFQAFGRVCFRRYHGRSRRHLYDDQRSNIGQVPEPIESDEDARLA